MNTTLVVMAAGMGSRFGGLKQAEPVYKDKTILDFSIYDAKRAGFDKVVFIIRKDIEEDFKEIVGDRIAKSIPVEYVIQDTDCLPEGRKKPFGTAHAVLCCRDVVKEPFAIINADDYYGKNAFYEVQKYLENASDNDISLVAYDLKNTMSKNGSVSRGVCETAHNKLKKITEIKQIEDFKYTDKSGNVQVLPEDTKVSMNLWGLTPAFFDVLEKEYKTFLDTADIMKDEFLVPEVIGKLIDGGEAEVQIFNNRDRWYGITYREDLPEIKEALQRLVEEGNYEGI